MLSRKPAVVASVVFWTALCAFAALYPGYSHMHRAVSELGAFGAPHALAWNLIGFIVPGLFLAVSGGGVALAIDGRRSLLFWLLVVSGLGFAGAGVIPAEMRDGHPDMQSAWTAGHLLAITLSGFPWVIAAFLLMVRVKRSARWQGLVGASRVLAVFALLGLGLNIFGRAIPALADTPGLAQRLAFAMYFGWFIAANALFLANERKGRPTDNPRRRHA